MTEELATLVDDDYEASSLDQVSKDVVAFTDAFLAAEQPTPAVRDAVVQAFGEPGVVELALGLALFHGFSKMLIALGLEPEVMDTVVLPTPDIA